MIVTTIVHIIMLALIHAITEYFLDPRLRAINAAKCVPMIKGDTIARPGKP